MAPHKEAEEMGDSNDSEEFEITEVCSADVFC